MPVVPLTGVIGPGAPPLERSARLMEKPQVVGLPIIGKMLGHSQPATTARYAHLASDPVKTAAAATAGKIAAAMAGGSSKTGKRSGTVMPIRSPIE